MSTPIIESFSPPDYSSSWFKDRLRFTIIEVNTNNILTRDLVVKEPEVTVQLSAPSRCGFKIDQGQAQIGQSAYGINWKNYGQWIIPEIETHIGRFCLGAQMVTDNKVDPESGDMVIDGTGFMGYPKEIPWLENFNPIAVDPAEVIQRIWAHLQSFPHANLGIDVQPSSTGTQMLPGYGFDGNILSFDFFALFIRAVDFPDCGDQMMALSRDLPFDMFEEVSWNRGPGPNLLNNGSFNFNLNNWSGTGESWDNSQGHDSNGSILFTANGTFQGASSEQIAVSPGDKINLSGWIRSNGFTHDGSSDPVYLYIESFDDSHSHVDWPSFGYPINPASPGGSAWEKLTCPTFTVPTGVRYVSAGIAVREKSLTGTVRFDDILLTKEIELRTEINKTLRIAYPLGGFVQNGLAFRLGENVINAEKAEELDIEPVSDVIIRSWAPGRVYSATLGNADMTRARRVIMEEDASITSSERAAAWAKRKLTRRNIPKSFSKITIDPEHSHAPFGTWWVGDSIYVEAPDYPWHGDIKEWHRITSFTVKGDEPLVELGLKVEGAFNYDPIEFNPDYDQQPTEDPNLLSNGYFTNNLSGWKAVRGQWFRTAAFGYTSDGCVRVDLDDDGEEFQSNKISIIPGETLHIQAAVRYQELVQTGTPPYTFAVAVNTHLNGGDVTRGIIVDSFTHDGTGPFTPMSGDFTVPATGVGEISVSLLVNSAVTGGISFWDDVRVLR
jgi:hypothetical protein